MTVSKHRKVEGHADELVVQGRRDPLPGKSIQAAGHHHGAPERPPSRSARRDPLPWNLSRPQGITTALRGARHPDQLDPVGAVMGWSLDAAKAEIDRTLSETITDPVGPEFMAPPARS